MVEVGAAAMGAAGYGCCEPGSAFASLDVEEVKMLSRSVKRDIEELHPAAVPQTSRTATPRAKESPLPRKTLTRMTRPVLLEWNGMIRAC